MWVKQRTQGFTQVQFVFICACFQMYLYGPNPRKYQVAVIQEGLLEVGMLGGWSYMLPQHDGDGRPAPMPAEVAL